MQFARERLATVREEIGVLLEEHYQALCLHKDTIALEPDWLRYAMLDQEGDCVIFTLRDDDRELVGYATFFLSYHPHYLSHYCALNDLLWLRPKARRPTIGVRFVQQCEAWLRSERRVNRITWRSKLNQPLIPLLEHLGYAPEEINLTKVFKE